MSKHPPESADARLPREMRPTLFTGVDGTFASVLIGFLAIELTGAVALAQRPVLTPEVLDFEALPDRFPTTVLPPPRQAKLETPPPRAPMATKPGSGSATPPSPRIASASELRDDVSRRGALGLLTAKNLALGQIVQSAIGPEAPSVELANAIAGAYGRLEQGSDPLASASRKDPGSVIAHTEELRTEGGDVQQPSAHHDAALPSPHLGLDPNDPTLPAGPDSQRIADFVRTHLRSLAFCYEHELKTHPDLHGRLAIRFVIGTNGHVTDAEVEEDGLGSDRLAHCMTEHIDRWELPFLLHDEAAVVFPFVFAPTSG